MDWSGFHRLDRAERLRRVADHVGIEADEAAGLADALSRGLPEDLQEAFIENAVGAFSVPIGVAVHFVVDGRPVVVPMATEESSVIAAASHGAKLAAAGGGFTTEAPEPVMLGQIEVRGAKVTDPTAALEAHQAAWMAALDASMPTMVARGGGMRDITARRVGDRVLVELHVDVRDAMGANLVNTLCESIADAVAAAFGGQPGLRILTNLATDRVVRSSCRVPVAALGGIEAARAIVSADELAHMDPWRATTHNKGIMNGISAVVLATGNDTRAVEAGAHAYAAVAGGYRALTTWRLEGDALVGRLALPVAVGTVGGVTSLHPAARACLRILGDPDAAGLASIIASVGLAQNLAALHALAGDGIQAGHMRLHQENIALRGAAEPSNNV